MSLSPSPFQHILNTNYVPDSDESDKIRQYCVEPEARLDLIQDEMSVLQERLSRLAYEQTTLKLAVGQHKALLSPMRRLIPELLSHIFVFCLPLTQDGPYPAMHPSESPMLLTQVCAQWREVALSTPLLWSRLHLVIPPSPWDPFESSTSHKTRRVSRLEGARVWLSRAGHCPLNLSLYATSSSDQSVSIEALQVLLRHSRTWKSVKLVLPSPCLLLLNDVQPESLPSLTEFEAQVLREPPSSPTDSPPLIPSLAFMTRLSSLRTFRLNSAHIQATLPNVPWRQLVDLQLDLMNSTLGLAEFLTFFGQCESLCSARLSMPYFSGHPSSTLLDTLKNCTLPQLRTLHIIMTDHAHFVGMTDSCSLVDRLTLPALQKLHLDIPPLGIQQIQTRQFDCLRRLLTRSGCDLQELSLRHASASYESIVACLRAAPNLQALDIECSDASRLQEEQPSSDSMLDILHTLDPQRVPLNELLCPNLRHLTVSRCPKPHQQALWNILESRLSVTDERARLVSARYHFEFAEQTIFGEDQVRRLRESGLDLNVRHVKPWTPMFHSSSPWDGLPRRGAHRPNPSFPTVLPPW